MFRLLKFFNTRFKLLKIKDSENDASESCLVCGVTEVGGTDACVVHLPAVSALRAVGAVALVARTLLYKGT